ncbi:hypothetical protein JKG47_05535 [Acidithiobacillus sp. MC6.1]|nr:hypothetical protein [Acidithiobacillus sp. MC6.1]
MILPTWPCTEAKCKGWEGVLHSVPGFAPDGVGVYGPITRTQHLTPEGAVDTGQTRRPQCMPERRL